MDYTVAAVDEALSLMFLVAQHPGLGVTELAKRSDNTKARTFRLLCTLEQRGLVQRDGSACYTLGYKVLHLGVAAQEQVSLVRLANAFLREIGHRCNENVQLRVRDGLDSVCVARWESTQAVRVHSDVGNRRPLHAGAASKVLLAFAPEEIRQAVLTGELSRFTPSTIVNRSKLAQELSKIKTQGYAASFGEMSADAVAVGAPVFDVSGMVVAALSVAGPASRISKNNLQTFIDLVTATAAELSRALGHTGISSITGKGQRDLKTANSKKTVTPLSVRPKAKSEKA